MGSTRVRSANVRIISATHRNLEKRASSGLFRQDLFFRLAVAVVEVPTLRSRPEDMVSLAQHFAKARSGLAVTLSPATLAALQCNPWVGNVRELRNAIERAVTLGLVEAAPTEASSPPSFKEARERLLEQFERDYLEALLRRHRDSISAAARAAGLSEPTSTA